MGDDWMIELRSLMFVLLITFLALICLFAGINVAMSLSSPPTMESCKK